MAYRFPSTIKAARISTFISTAAWIQGSVAVPVGDVWLPEEALNNFLKRNTANAPRDTNNTTSPAPGGGGVVLPGAGEDGQDDEEESVDSSADGVESADSSQSSDSAGGSTKDGEKEGESDGAQPVTPVPVQDGIGTDPQATPAVSADAGDAQRATSGLSPGGQAAIAVWVIIAVIAAGVGFWWFRRRRRRQRSDGLSSVQDSEASRSQPMAAQGALPSILPPPAPALPTTMDPAFFAMAENHQPGADYVMRAQPQPDNDGIPFGADSQSWRQSPPPGAYGGGGGGGGIPPLEAKRASSRIGLPLNPRPGSQREMVIGAPMMNGPSYRRDPDAQTVVTDGPESTIFDWR